MRTAREVAEHYRPGVGESGGNYQIKCPCHTPHEGQGQNLSVKDAPGGGLLVHCFSRGCSFNDILDAFRRDGLTVSREWVYPGGKTVRRTDGADIRKGRHFKGSDSQSVKGEGLLVRGDSPGALLVITEGESDADAVLSMSAEDEAVACFAGGCANAGHADYSAVRDRNVAIWMDNDKKGETAKEEAALACHKAGAASISIIPPVGAHGEGMGAADLSAEALPLWITARQLWAAPEIRAASSSGIVWTSIADVLEAPPAEWLVNGLLAAGSITLLIGSPKAGKTMLVLSLLKAAATGGRFLGSTLGEPKRSWLFTEQSERSLAAQVRMVGLDSENVKIALWRQQPGYETPQDFADAVHADFMAATKKPAILVIDTLGSWVDLKDANDYSQVTERLQPILKMGQIVGDAEGTATLLVHHTRKSGGDGSDKSLGSQKIAAMVDTMAYLGNGDGERRRLSIQSRFGITDLGSDLSIVLDLNTGSYDVVDTGAEVDDEIKAILENGDLGSNDLKDQLKDAGMELSQSGVNRHLKGLMDSGVVERQGKARNTVYHLVGESIHSL